MFAQSTQQLSQHSQYVIRKVKAQIIDKFEEYHSFLSNDEPAWVLYQGIEYPSVSVAFQAARCVDIETKKRMADVDSPEELMEIAQTIEDPPNWENNRLRIMEILIRDKFRRSLEMRERLRLTEEKQIINRFAEDTPSNLFWGFVGNKGENQIGRILERIRADIAENSDLKKWMMQKFPLENDRILLPVITLDVYKEGSIIETIQLKERSYYYMGQYKTNSVLLAHPSISRLHACLICEEGQRVRLIDFESKSGSFVNGQIINKLHDCEVHNNDVLSFALSTRTYTITIDYRQADKELQQRFLKHQQEVAQLQRLSNPTLSVEELRRIMGFSLDDTLFIQNIPDKFAQIPVIQGLFEGIAKVKQVSIPVDRRSGRPRGFAYVIFENNEEFRKAHLRSMKMELGGVHLKVKIADKEKSSALVDGFRFSGGETREEPRKKTEEAKYLDRFISAQGNREVREKHERSSKFDRREGDAIKTEERENTRQKEKEQEKEKEKEKEKSARRSKSKSKSRSRSPRRKSTRNSSRSPKRSHRDSHRNNRRSSRSGSRDRRKGSRRSYSPRRKDRRRSSSSRPRRDSPPSHKRRDDRKKEQSSRHSNERSSRTEKQDRNEKSERNGKSDRRTNDSKATKDSSKNESKEQKEEQNNSKKPSTPPSKSDKNMKEQKKRSSSRESSHSSQDSSSFSNQ